MQPRLAALEPPVLADRRLGQRAAGADSEQRERAQRLVLARRGASSHRSGSHARPGRSALEVAPLGDHEHALVPQRVEHHLRRLPVPHPPPPWPSKSRDASGPSAGSARAPARRDRRASPAHGRGAPVAAALHHGPEVRPQLDREQRRLVRPVLEDAARAQEARHGVSSGRRRRARSASADERGRRSRSSRAAPPSAGGSLPRPRRRRHAGSARRSPAATRRRTRRAESLANARAGPRQRLAAARGTRAGRSASPRRSACLVRDDDRIRAAGQRGDDLVDRRVASTAASGPASRRRRPRAARRRS